MGFIKSFLRSQKYWTASKKGSRSEFEDGTIIYNLDVTKFAMQHSSLFDWFFPSRITSIILWSRRILEQPKNFNIPNKKNWKFGKDF